jgi:hypothetical protein
MTKLELLYAQKSEKFGEDAVAAREVCLHAIRVSYGELSTLSVEDRIRVEDEAKHYVPSKSADQLEGLIRDKLPDPVGQHLIDVIIERIDADGLAENWTAQPVWNHDVSNNDEREFIGALFKVLRDYDLSTDE